MIFLLLLAYWKWHDAQPSGSFERLKKLGLAIIHRKGIIVVASVLFAICGSVLGTNDLDACVNLHVAGVIGTVYTGIGIVLAALASF